MKSFVLIFICGILAQTASAQLSGAQNPVQQAEFMAMLTNLNHGASLVWRAAMIQRMVQEANYFADRLKLPTKLPIEVTDIQVDHIPSPSFCVLQQARPSYYPNTIFGTHIYDTNIPREQRLRALKIGLSGQITTTNFKFAFAQGRLRQVVRLSEPDVEYYSRNLDKLVGQLSLIDTNGAYKLATQWLATVGVDVPALERQFGHSVNQLLYSPRGATNAVLLPLYYVGFGTNNSPKWKPASYDPAVEVEILGTTKELQDLEINDTSFSRRPLLLITNALELTQTLNPSVKQLQNPATAQAYALTLAQVSNYAGNFQLSRAIVTNALKGPRD